MNVLLDKKIARVYRGLDCCLPTDEKPDADCMMCPYFENDHCVDALKREVWQLILLKQSIKVRKALFNKLGDTAIYKYYCQNCNKEVAVGTRYCSWCGRKMNWSEVYDDSTED